ncbi:MAG: DUF3634 family protein [Phycisphaeraceae bacterium]|nr:DUF3634 family protein [Phycisphaeraceae bacterium]
MEWLVLVVGLLLVAVAAVVWHWAGGGGRFALEIENGEIAGRRGEVPPGFERDVERLCRLWQVESGQIRGRQIGGRWEVTCSGETEKCARALENALDHPL